MNAPRAVILARGAGRRMQAADDGVSLTPEQQRAADSGQKALMPIGGRPFLDYLLSRLADAGVADVALIVAPDHAAVRRRYAIESQPTRVQLTFIVQPEALGTANAVLAAERWVGNSLFLVMNGDNLYPAEVLQALCALREPGLPGFERADLVRSSNIPEERLQAFALIETDDHGYLTRVVEKPSPTVLAAAGARARVSMNCWRFDTRIFDACRDVPRSPRGEFELPEAVMLAVERGVPFRVIPARGPVLDLSRRADAAEVSRRLAGMDLRP
jgi:glucose-1-phosphate thymidylyltransferase